MTKKLKPINPSPLAVVIDGQVYREVGTVPYVTRFDKEIRLVRMATRCPICDRRFEVTVTRTDARQRRLTRRCPEHRIPGWPVHRHVAFAKRQAARAHAEAIMAMFD